MADLASYNDLCFQYFWELICKTDEREPHCLRHGCGSKTFSCWVWIACGIRVPPNILKRTLLIAVERGMATTSISSCNFRRFNLIAPHRKRQDQRERYQNALHRHFLAKTVRNEPLSAHASEELRELARSLDLSQAEVDDIHQYMLESSERWGSAYA
jgi:hypothetical protein